VAAETGKSRSTGTLDPVHPVAIHRHADEALRAEVGALLDRVEHSGRVRFLSDHLWLDLLHGGRDGFTAATARADDGALIAYGQASAANEGYVVEAGSGAAADAAIALERDVLGAILADLRDRHVGPVTWWVHDVTTEHDSLASRLGLKPERDLYQMRRPLPTGREVSVTTRPFDPSRDEEAWLSVNNRAFAAHGEQGGWDLATLRQREAEEWFDPDGFRIHERDGRIAAFCWTKLHLDLDPPIGEIYVIAVDPDHQGLGLGRQLTLAGLASIENRGIATAMLYVDATNAAAVELYRELGFEVHRTDRAYLDTSVQAT
jgi:mycothiol synthase